MYNVIFHCFSRISLCLCVIFCNSTVKCPVPGQGRWYESRRNQRDTAKCSLNGICKAQEWAHCRTGFNVMQHRKQLTTPSVVLSRSLQSTCVFTLVSIVKPNWIEVKNIPQPYPETNHNLSWRLLRVARNPIYNMGSATKRTEEPSEINGVRSRK